MSALREIEVDPEARTATVEPGCLLQDSTARRSAMAWRRHRLLRRSGSRADARRGLGYLTRRFGWTVDNLLEVEIVTADGSVRRAAADENEDLFWAVRGAGANVGVVTSFKFRLHEVDRASTAG